MFEVLRSNMISFIAVALLAAGPVLANNATCYYPNGKIAKDSFPCGGNTPMCCPLNWACLDNGICQNPADDTLGRYACTDQNFNSDVGCPQNCVRKESLAGNEDVRLCGPELGCCNTNGAGNCCSNLKAAATFNFGAGNSIATITASMGSSPTTNSGTPSVSSVGDSSPDSSTSSTAPTMVAGPPQVNSPGTPISITAPTSVRATTDGSAPTSQSSSMATSKSSSSAQSGAPVTSQTQRIGTGGIVGIAIAVPLSAVVVGMMVWLFFMRRKSSNRPAPLVNFNPDANEKPHNTFNGGIAAFAHSNRTSYPPSEIDSREVRVPIHSSVDAKVATATTNIPRDETTDTLYPDSQPRYYANQTGPSQPMSPTPSSAFSHPSQDYSEWAVTPRLQQQRWSGRSEEGSGVIGGRGAQATGSGGDGEGGVPPQAHELMGRPQIPPTIHELP